MLPGVGVFGTSLTTRVIIPLLKNEGFAVKALWGRTQEEAEELAKEMNVPFYTNRIDDVLLHQDVDLVCINLPPPLTRQIAVKTLGESCCCRRRCRWAGWMLRPWRGGGLLLGGELTDGATDTFTQLCGFIKLQWSRSLVTGCGWAEGLIHAMSSCIHLSLCSPSLNGSALLV